MTPFDRVSVLLFLELLLLSDALLLLLDVASFIAFLLDLARRLGFALHLVTSEESFVGCHWLFDIDL